MRICVTGHRPKLLYCYDLNNEKWQALKEKFKLLLQEEKCTEAITGMALGTDQIFALAVLELKESGKDIKLTCAIPCKAQNCITRYYRKLTQLYKCQNWNMSRA